MSDVPAAPGDRIARKYRVERVLGSGAMGVVVAARHEELGQLVAVKHLITGRAVSEEQRGRFLREARAAVVLKSHHVARVLDVGADDNEAPYIVMEFLDGQDLAATLKARRQLPFEEAVEYVLQACEAVGEAHAAGIVHRDLKPANLFLTHDVSGAPCVKVLDFGISKLVGTDVALTHESQMLGSPLYMSPEQMNAPKSVDARSDVWALGVILYQLVAGKTPFHGETIQGVCALVIGGQPTPLRVYRPDAPPGFDAVILRCLARDREQRYRDVAEFSAALGAYAPARARVYVERIARVVTSRGGRGSSSAEIVVAAGTGAGATMPLPGTVGAVSGPARGSRGRPVSVAALIGAGALAAVLAGGVVVLFLMKAQSSTGAEAGAEAEAGAVAEAGAEAGADAGAEARAAAAEVPTVAPIVSSARGEGPVKPVVTSKPVLPSKTTAKPSKRNEDLYNP